MFKGRKAALMGLLLLLKQAHQRCKGPAAPLVSLSTQKPSRTSINVTPPPVGGEDVSL